MVGAAILTNGNAAMAVEQRRKRYWKRNHTKVLSLCNIFSRYLVWIHSCPAGYRTTAWDNIGNAAGQLPQHDDPVMIYARSVPQIAS